jgi:cytochrome c peroxidase
VSVAKPIAILFVLFLLTHATASAGQAISPEMRLEALPEHAPDPEDNPITPAKVALGRLLFFDPILSATKDVACATCHHARFGWGDGRATPIGANGSGLGPERKFLVATPLAPLPRNAPTLLNVGFNGLVAGARPQAVAAPMFWDARVTGLEKQILAPLQSREEMRGDVCAEAEAIEQAITRVREIAEYRELFSQTFHEPQSVAVTIAHLTQAIAAFERSLVMTRTPFDRFLRGDKSALNTEQQRGLQAFQDAGCIQCHGGPMFSDFKLHFIGVPDDTLDGRREFRTPTLRHLKHTAPYMHNGSQRTLRDVLVFYEALSDAVSETLDGGDTPPSRASTHC